MESSRNKKTTHKSKKSGQKPLTPAAKQRRLQNRRVTFILVIFLILAAVIVGKLVYLQIIDSSDQYARQVDQVVDQVQVQASRGNIYDRNGNILAQDSSAKAVYIIPSEITDEDKLVKELAQKLDLKEDSLRKKAEKLENDYVIVKNSISASEGQRAHALDRDGLKYRDGTLYAYPDKIDDAKTTAKALAAIFDNLSYKTALGYLTEKENSAVLIKSQVDNSLANKILKDMTVKKNGEVQSTNGVELIDDSRRYYTNGNFASYVLGFTNQNYQGVSGVESTYNSWLSGQNGLAYLQKDASGNTLPSLTKVVKQPKKGKDLVLTIDSNIQIMAEKALNESIKEWKAKRGTAIVMDVDTGEILAMATKPDYDLNNPYTLNKTYAKNYSDQLDGKSNADKLNLMWSNPAVSFTYEPGSTFKPITASSAFEEGAISPSDKVVCNGSINIDGVMINCTATHGVQTAAEAVSNSCNPGLVQIIQKLDPTLFYRYAYDYGFGKTTGIELPGEEAGVMTRVFKSGNSINLLDYSNLSFGQGLMTTPIQLLSALNSVINNGHYMRPTVISSQNKGISSNASTSASKQIISKATSKEMRQIMEKVVTNNPELASLAGDYSIGGKTGTAQKVENGEYSHSKYVTSFFGFTPVKNPKYAVLVVIDEAQSGAYGAQSAAPAAIKILQQTSDYMNPSSKSSTKMTKNTVTVPDVTGQEVEFAKEILKEKGITYKVDDSAGGSVVASQSLKAKSTYKSGKTMVLVTGKSADDTNAKVTVPDLSGMNIQEANEILTGLGLKIKVKGSGFAVSQNPKAGTKVNRNSKVTVTFKQK